MQQSQKINTLCETRLEKASGHWVDPGVEACQGGGDEISQVVVW